LSDPETEHCSDDGEPAGTAGKPILYAVRQSGMVNLMVVVTRYFGGIKLGVRGLIEAYGETAGSVIAKTNRVLRMRSKSLVISLPYSIIGDVVRLLETYGTDVPTWKYGAEAEVYAEVKLSAVSQVTVALRELQAKNLIFSWSWF
jgi:putative IMPACT (imprinted ancient) family translation regulator